jgi:hypothetical protein
MDGWFARQIGTDATAMLATDNPLVVVESAADMLLTPDRATEVLL